MPDASGVALFDRRAVPQDGDQRIMQPKRRAGPTPSPGHSERRSGPSGPDLLAAGLAAMRRGDFAEAETRYRAFVATHPTHAEAHRHLGLIAAKRGDYPGAAALIRRAVTLDPVNADAHANLGVILRHLGQNEEAVTMARHAVTLESDQAAHHAALALTLMAKGDLAAACQAFERAGPQGLRSADLLFKYAETLRRLKRPDEASAICARGRALDPGSSEGLNLQGLLLDESGQAAGALSAFQGALRGTTQDAVICANIASVHFNEQKLDEAVVFARKALAIDAKNAAALGSLGMIYQRQGRIKEAIETFSQAITADPRCVRHYTNLTSLMIGIGQADAAIAASRLAIGIDPEDAEAHFNLAVALRQKDRGPEAIAAYRQALALGCTEALIDICHLRQQSCDWQGLAEEQAAAQATTYRLGRNAAPFSVMTASDLPDEHKLCAITHAGIFPQPDRPLAPYASAVGTPADARIRVGYLSCDFYKHATTSLIAQLFERHDRARFETFGYSFGPDDGSAMRRRIIAALDHFVDIRDLSHIEAARRIQADGIDILIDLKGYTFGARTEILCYRPAPIQVNFLGYPGTMGARFIDYVVGDAVVTPMDHAGAYTEAIVQLPGSYQPNDRLRPVADAIGTRADFGLPTTGVVFCCFNNNYKFTPRVFAVWMRLLQAVSGAVLWLIETADAVPANLRREAALHGVAPERLVFAPRVPADRHIARMALADLFLDTLPVNAHTTASEALWAGLPVLTCIGQAFAGRVAASLLAAVGLPQLVTQTLDDYERTALHLARNPAALADLRSHLAANRLTAPLFDIERYTASFETALAHMAALRRGGRPPEPFAVAAADVAIPDQPPRAPASTSP